MSSGVVVISVYLEKGEISLINVEFNRKLVILLWGQSKKNDNS